MNELPNGWEVATIGDVTLPKVPQGAPEEKSTFTYVDISSVDNVAKRIANARSFVGKDAPSRARQHLAPNDVLVSMTRPNLNAVAKVPADLDGAIGSTGFDVLRCQEIEPDWIFYTVRSPAFVQAMSDLVQGALYPAVRSEDVRSYQIPLPPRNEQRRIVAKLDPLFEKSRSIREKLDRLPRLLANLQKSILNSAFRGDLTNEWRANNPNAEPASELLKRIRAERRAKWEADLIAKGKDPKKAKYVEPEPADTEGLPELPEGWCWATWNELSNWITYGFTRPMPHVDHGVPIITAKNIKDSKVDLSNCHLTLPEAYAALSDKDRPKKGDILFTKDGTIGRAGIVDFESQFCINQSVAVIQLRSCPIDRRYLLRVLESPLTQIPIAEAAKGMAIQHVSITDFGRMPLPVPPAKEIPVLVSKIEAMLEAANRFILSQCGLEVEFNKLSSSVLRAAFRGELVPQDPNDEPASVLLERIRTQKPVVGTKRGRGRKAAA